MNWFLECGEYSEIVKTKNKRQQVGSTSATVPPATVSTFMTKEDNVCPKYKFSDLPI